MFTKLRKDIRELITDDSGRLSLAKTQLALGFLFVSAFLWELIVTKTITPEYLIIYVTFVSGGHLASKWIDNRQPDDK